MSEKTVKWLKKMGLTTIKTMAETALGIIGGSVLLSDVNWALVGSAVLLSGITTILFNIKSISADDIEK